MHAKLLHYLLLPVFCFVLTSCEIAYFEGSSSNSVIVYWSAPVQRVNGQSVTIDEIAGYEIRYKSSGDSDFTYIFVNSASQEQIAIDNLPYDTPITFEVAAIDNYGIYSRYATAQVN